MASTPSASALSAVLRCRGNIWTRNPPTKRPATSAYSLGLAGGALRDSPAERTGSQQASAWEAFLQGERVVVGRRLTVAYRSDSKTQRERDPREVKRFCCPKLWHSPGSALSAAPGVQNALVCQLARRLTSSLPARDKCSKITDMIKHQTYAAHICKVLLVQDISELPAGVLKLSLTSPCRTGDAGQVVRTGWSTLKSTCLSLTALVSKLIFLRLMVLCRSSSSSSSSPDGAHLLSQQEEETIRNDALRVNGQIHTSFEDKPGSGQEMTQDRPA